MPNDDQRYDFDRVFRLLITVGGLLGLFWLLQVLSSVLVPFAVALLLAYLLNPIVNAFEHKTNHRGLAVLLTLSIFTVAIAVLVPLGGALFYRELRGVAAVLTSDSVKEHIQNALEPVDDLISSPEFREKLREFRESADSEQVTQFAVGFVREALPKLWTATGIAASFLGSMVNAFLALTGLVIVFLYVVFLLLDFRRVQAGWKEQLPPQYRDSIVDFLHEFSLAMGRYFRGQFLVAMSCGVLFAIGFRLVNIEMAVALGLFVGLLNMVPYLQSIGLIPALALAILKAFESGESVFWPVAGVLVVFAVVQVIQDGFLVPKILGQSTGLRPWVIMLSIFVWGQLLGFLGLVLAIPLSCLGLAYYRKFILKQPQSTTASA